MSTLLLELLFVKRSKSIGSFVMGLTSRAATTLAHSRADKWHVLDVEGSARLSQEDQLPLDRTEHSLAERCELCQLERSQVVLRDLEFTIELEQPDHRLGSLVLPHLSRLRD